MHPTNRGKLLFKLADLVDKNRDILATLETWDMGKPYTVAKTEDVQDVIDVLRSAGQFRRTFHVGLLTLSQILWWFRRQDQRSDH